MRLLCSIPAASPLGNAVSVDIVLGADGIVRLVQGALVPFGPTGVHTRPSIVPWYDVPYSQKALRDWVEMRAQECPQEARAIREFGEAIVVSMAAKESPRPSLRVMHSLAALGVPMDLECYQDIYAQYEEGGSRCPVRRRILEAVAQTQSIVYPDQPAQAMPFAP